MICFCVLAQVSTGVGAEQRQSKAESVLPQCCRLKDQQINPDLWKQVNKWFSIFATRCQLPMFGWNYYHWRFFRTGAWVWFLVPCIDRQRTIFLLFLGWIFTHFGQPIIFFLVEWLEVPSYPYLTGKWCSYPNTIDLKPRMYVRTL